MLSTKLVHERLSQIRASAIRLQKLIAHGKDNFVSEPDNFAIAEHHLRRALEAVLDIGRHIIAKQGLGVPNDYRGILLALGQHGVLPQEFVRKVQGMAGYRNRLVHGYADVSPQEIYDVLDRHLKDLAEFSERILAFLESERD